MASSVFHTITSLAVLLCFSHIKCENIEDCILSIRVPQNTVWIVPEMKTLKINCTLEFDSLCGKNSTVSWCKIDDINECQPLNGSNYIETEWSKISESKSMSFLIFWSVSMQDSGLYRCKLDGPVPSVSHNINVTVTAVNLDSEDVSHENKTTDKEAKEQRGSTQFYVVYAVVTVVTVLLIIPVLFKISSSSKELTLEEKVTLTTVSYEAAEDSRARD